MTVGNQPSVASINQALTSCFLALRNTANMISNYQKEIIAMGAAGLENLGGVGQGFSAADAATVIQMFNYMSTLSGVYYGTATQAAEFDFDNALCGLWGGQ